jgi:hypothetical protein
MLAFGTPLKSSAMPSWQHLPSFPSGTPQSSYGVPFGKKVTVVRDSLLFPRRARCHPHIGHLDDRLRLGTDDALSRLIAAEYRSTP